MDKKITRRVALGSIAGGLAGAALLIHQTKSRYSLSLPDGGCKDTANWERDLKLVDVPVKDIDGPSAFVLDYRPQVGTRLPAACLYASYEKEDYPKPPTWHSLATGQVTVRPPIAGDLPALLVVAQENETFRVKQNDEKPAGKCLAVPKIIEGVIDGFSYYELTDRTSTELSPAKVSSSCRTLADAVMFNYPPGRTLAKGAKWTVPESLSHSVELLCEVVGFAEIAGKKTAKIFAEQRLDNQQYQHYVARSWQAAKKLGFGTGSDAELREELDQAVQRKLSLSIQVTFFIDLSSGICVRNNAVMSVRGPSYAHTAVQISQVLDA